MRLAVSNLAWPSGADAEAAPILRDHGVQGVELAPGKIWPRPLEATPAEVRAYRQSWERHGLTVVAMQALLFGRADLTVFGDPASRRQLIEYLQGLFGLAEQLGAEVLVFGSPGNRRRNGVGLAEAEAVAIPLFRELGERAEEHKVWLCIEPNPASYGCDFVTTAAEGLAVVQRVNQQGFGLHLDAAGMALSGDPLEPTFRAAAGWWRHMHVSETNLQPIGSGTTPHAEMAATLSRVVTPPWLSIEMKEWPGHGPWSSTLAQTLKYVRTTYAACLDGE